MTEDKWIFKNVNTCSAAAGSPMKLVFIKDNELFLSMPEMCVKALVNLPCLQTTHGIDSDC